MFCNSDIGLLLMAQSSNTGGAECQEYKNIGVEVSTSLQNFLSED